FGTNQLRVATYWTKCFQSPQETFLAPYLPSAPNRSATDTRKVMPRANRRSTLATYKTRSFVIAALLTPLIDATLRLAVCIGCGHYGSRFHPLRLSLQSLNLTPKAMVG